MITPILNILAGHFVFRVTTKTKEKAQNTKNTTGVS